MKITMDVYYQLKNQPILHDEDLWHGKYKTYGEMWNGENYEIIEDSYDLWADVEEFERRYNNVQSD